jgi:opacity protein-like surface antigen
MKVIGHTTRPAGNIILTLTVFLMMVPICTAQDWSRKGKSEFFGVFQTMGGDTTTGLGITLEMSDFTLYGLGLGYNPTDHWNVNTNLLFGSTDITGTELGITVTDDCSIWGWDVNLDYNILKDRLTPLVSAGIGFFNLNSFGASETDFSYKLGAGLRWDVTDNLSLKAMYNCTWTTMEDTDSALQLDGFSFGIAYMF